METSGEAVERWLVIAKLFGTIALVFIVGGWLAPKMGWFVA